MSDLHNYANLRLIKTFGRLKGRALSKNQKLGLALHKQKYNFFLETEKKIWLEVGFGNGHHLVELAKRNYDKLYLDITIEVLEKMMEQKKDNQEIVEQLDKALLIVQRENYDN